MDYQGLMCAVLGMEPYILGTLLLVRSTYLWDSLCVLYIDNSV